MNKLTSTKIEYIAEKYDYITFNQKIISDVTDTLDFAVWNLIHVFKTEVLKWFT